MRATPASAYDLEDTICAVASAPGGGWRGIVRISGPQMAELLAMGWRPAVAPQAAPRSERRAPHQADGCWLLPAPCAPLPCRLYLWPTPRSYTRQPTAEIHTIGSPPLLQLLLRQLCDHGARLAEPGEFTLRAFLAGRLDLAQAEAVLGVIDAQNERQLGVALTQLAGNLSGELDVVRDELLNLCADIEASLDFADEDILLITPSQVRATLEGAATRIESLGLQMRGRGRADDSPRVVLRGRPNVGKSTLWNALLGDGAALVSDIPGTTRDYLEADLPLAQGSCRLIDTAGIDEQLVMAVDRDAQRLSLQRAELSDLRLLCLDTTRGPDDWEFRQLLDAPSPDLVVLTKADQGDPCRYLDGFPTAARLLRPDRSSRPQWLEVDDEADGTRTWPVELVSAASGAGLAELRARVEKLLAERQQESVGVVSSTATRCALHLDECLAALHGAAALADSSDRYELVAAGLRQALDHVGCMVGAIYTDDILDRVFRRFCIGK
jgi:tRNA modification GTPase